MDECEALAKAVIEHVIPGSRMKFHFEQAHGNYDFDLVYPDGKLAAVEVTAAKDEHIEASIAAILSERKGGSFVPRHQCRNDWMVYPTPGARINRIRSQIDSYLAEAETEGLSHFFAYVDFFDSLAVRRLFEDLEIEAGDVVKWKKPAICITLPGQGTEWNPRKVDDAVLCEAQKKDNRRKLGNAEHSEKHLFVCIDPRFYAPWYAINKGQPSGLPMHLPEEIDILSGPLRVHDPQVSMQCGEPKESSLGKCWSRSRSRKSVADGNFKGTPGKLDVFDYDIDNGGRSHDPSL